jgi:glc operon protein GlcG
MRTKHALTSADVKTIIAACEVEAVKHNWAVAISVVDDSGILLGFTRMDGAPRVSGEVCVGKARTAAMTGRPSKFFEDVVKARPAFIDFPGTLIQGGVPIMHQNECVGGVGVSGVQSHEDEQVAQVGAVALG